MIALDAPNGLGDAIHLRALVLHLLARGEEITVFTGWPEVFTGLPITVRGLDDRTGEMRHCSASHLFPHDGLSMFAAACRGAGIAEPVELRMAWQPTNRALIRRVRQAAEGRRIFVYQPMKIAFGAEQELIQPLSMPFARYLKRYRDWFVVRLGCPRTAEDFGNADLDLFGKTTVQEAIDVATAADFLFSSPSYLPILAQALGKPYACMFSRRAAESEYPRARNLTPHFFLHDQRQGSAVYDA